jgi:protein-S-isoprenylcysteine O-methyltransferase Ste14
MKRPGPIIGSAVFLVLAPGTVAVFVPWWISRWQMSSPLLGFFGFRVIGILLAACGAGVLIDSFARFALQGLGTPAPLMPTRHLVITGLYRYVRNPMYVGVFSMIIGQALIFGNLRLLWYGLAAGAAAGLFVLLYEEPTLRRTFGSEYDEFCANVPRWIPRIIPWRKDTGAAP